MRNEHAMRDVMRRIEGRKPWGWVRFTDGDMFALDKNSAVSDRMRGALTEWPLMPNLVVSVGEWFLCSPKLLDIWRRRLQTNAMAQYVFHAGCFYLPMGTPEDDDFDVWGEKNISGWVRTALDNNIMLALVGPRSLAGVLWLSGSGWGERGAGEYAKRFEDASGVTDHATNMDAAISKIERISTAHGTEPVLFVFSAGHAAKTMITELMHATSKDMFVDAGTALDGFAGIGSREFNKGTKGVVKYCENVLRPDPVRLKFWIDPGKLKKVCKGVDLGNL